MTLHEVQVAGADQSESLGRYSFAQGDVVMADLDGFQALEKPVGSGLATHPTRELVRPGLDHRKISIRHGH